jgi:hypothetical protein
MNIYGVIISQELLLIIYIYIYIYIYGKGKLKSICFSRVDEI